jgi:hypothetical protein
MQMTFIFIQGFFMKQLKWERTRNLDKREKRAYSNKSQKQIPKTNPKTEAEHPILGT